MGKTLLYAGPQRIGIDRHYRDYRLPGTAIHLILTSTPDRRDAAYDGDGDQVVSRRSS